MYIYICHHYQIDPRYKVNGTKAMSNVANIKINELYIIIIITNYKECYATSTI